MLLWLLEYLQTFSSSDAWVALEKITFRASLAAGTSFVAALVLGPRLIRWLRARFREPIVGDSDRLNHLHRRKQATPTMGGLFLVAGLVVGVLLFGDLTNRFVQLALVVAIGLAVVGAIDDLAKLRGNSKGISPQWKLFGQLFVATVVSIVLYHHHAALPEGLALRLPVIGTVGTLGLGFVPLAVLVIVGSSNAVNLTDGLDGLAGGCLLCATGAMAMVVYAAGHAEWAAYLGVPRVPGAGELTLLAGGMAGAMLGFLWFNCHPAQVFMGDTGSLPMGGLLGFLAVVTRQEFLLLVVGGVFAVETLSVMLQVGYYRWRRRRILLCAPLHHHFQFQGWPETRIVTRFWIAAALCALVGLASLKTTIHEPSPILPLKERSRVSILLLK